MKKPVRRGKILPALLVLCVSTIVSVRPALAQGPGQGDPKLSQLAVAQWFNYNIATRGGRASAVRSGNQVEAYLDGEEAFAAMAKAIRTASASVKEPGSAGLTETDPDPPIPGYYALHHFGPDLKGPIWPNAPGVLVEGKDGDLYSTTPSGGKNGQGTVFKITPDGKTLTVLHDFELPTGGGPLSGLTRRSDGNFYGTTYAGGKYNTGVIFQITPDGSYTDLWDFRNGRIVPPLPYPKQPTEQQKLDAAGSYPVGPPLLGRNGTLYGVTTYTNNQQGGVLYTGTLHGLYYFKGENGYLPVALVAGADGNLYGTTVKGNASCPFGTVFKATPSGAVSTLHRFQFATGSVSVGLMQGRDGNLYGTASNGGALQCGVIYRLTMAGEYTILHTFTNGEDGSVPVAALVEAKDGYLYGTDTGGGSGGRGVVYRIRPDGSHFTVVYSFLHGWNTGRHSRITPIQHTDGPHYPGPLYGLTYEGGAFDSGVFYSLELPRFVYLLDWWLTDSFPLIPGDATSTLQNLLTEASQKDVQVRAMLWKQWRDYGVFGHRQNADEVDHINALSSGAAILDDRHLDYGSHHQKILVVSGSEGLIAFCGGVDFNPDRLYPQGAGPNANGDTQGAPLHDVHCSIRGPAAGDLLRIFQERWSDHPESANLDHNKGPLHIPPGRDPASVLDPSPVYRLPLLYTPAPIPGATDWVQVGRTFGNGVKHNGIGYTPGTGSTGYKFAPIGDQTAALMILNAIQRAQKYIYVEDQYFVDTDKNAVGLSLRATLAAKLREPNFKRLIVLIPHGDITDMGKDFLGLTIVDNQVNYRRKLMIDALNDAGAIKDAKGNVIGNKVSVFYLNPPGNYRTYVHAKTWIFDDQFAIIGSANVNRRSWTHDSEVVVGVCDEGQADASTYWFPHRLRMRLWAEHLGLPAKGYEAALRDFGTSAALWDHLPHGARVAPYTDFGPDGKHPDDPWNTKVDPDGS